MYTLIRAVVLPRTIGAQWKEVDLTNTYVENIFNSFTKIFVELSHPDLPSHIYVDFSVLRLEYSSYNGFIADLLTELGNRTLESVASMPDTTVRYATYGDSKQTSYKFELCKNGVNLPFNYDKNLMPDLSISKPRPYVDPKTIHDYCLTTVNGYIHYLDYNLEKAVIVGGAKTMRKGNDNRCGIISFQDIGKIQRIQLTDENIVPQSAGAPLKDRIYITTGLDLTNKSCFLVLGGYLVFIEDNRFWKINDNTFALNIQNVNYLERLMESRLTLDLSSLQLTPYEVNNESVFNVDEAYSDAVIRRYLKLSQSFLVVVNTPNLMVDRLYVQNHKTPGKFTSYVQPMYPLIVGHGKIGEYFTDRAFGAWDLTVTDSFYRNFLFVREIASPDGNINNHLDPEKPYGLSKGHMIRIGTYAQ